MWFPRVEGGRRGRGLPRLPAREVARRFSLGAGEAGDYKDFDGGGWHFACDECKPSGTSPRLAAPTDYSGSEPPRWTLLPSLARGQVPCLVSGLPP